MKYLEQKINTLGYFFSSCTLAMSEFKNYRKELKKAALWTSPLMALISFTPVFLYVDANPDQNIPFINFHFQEQVLLIIGISLWIFIQWGINIWLLMKFELPQGFFGWKAHWQRYTLSFSAVLIQSLVRFVILDFFDTDNIFFYLYPFITMSAVNVFILVLINLIVIRNEKATLQLEKAELEISQLITQQEQLKQQIHPHFLFNSLGTLQILIDKDKKVAMDYTASLANYLRTSLSLAQNDIISVKEELDFLTNYIQLQQMRFGKAIQYDIDIPQNIQMNAKLPVFSLQILAENAIKHNAFSTSNPLNILIQYQKDNTILVKNNLSPKFNKAIKSGIGLQNLSKRFSHFTDQLPVIEPSQKSFQVKLKLLGI